MKLIRHFGNVDHVYCTMHVLFHHSHVVHVERWTLFFDANCTLILFYCEMHFSHSLSTNHCLSPIQDAVKHSPIDDNKGNVCSWIINRSYFTQTSVLSTSWLLPAFKLVMLHIQPFSSRTFSRLRVRKCLNPFYTYIVVWSYGCRVMFLGFILVISLQSSPKFNFIRRTMFKVRSLPFKFRSEFDSPDTTELEHIQTMQFRVVWRIGHRTW